jgi:hypothetical protein
MSSITHGVLLLILGMADIVWGLRMFALSRESARTGRPFRELENAVPTALAGVLLNVGLVIVASTS